MNQIKIPAEACAFLYAVALALRKLAIPSSPATFQVHFVLSARGCANIDSGTTSLKSDQQFLDFRPVAFLARFIFRRATCSSPGSVV
jgi:hypothetical protein